MAAQQGVNEEEMIAGVGAKSFGGSRLFFFVHTTLHETDSGGVSFI